MEIIDGAWITARLARHHGAKGEMADAIGMARDKLAKVLQGKRKLTPAEISRVVRYFDAVRPAIAAPAPPGFSDEAEPFRPAPAPDSPRGPVHSLFGHMAANPEVTHRAKVMLPELSICPGDQIICDLSRAPQPGEVVMVDIADPVTNETSHHLIRRYLPPFLACGSAGLAHSQLRETDPGVFIRYPVVGILRTAG